jgi:hypothetical protein
MVGIPISISTDVSVGVAAHLALVMPPIIPSPVPMSPTIEIPCPMKWPPGSIKGTHKLTTTVLYNAKRPVVQDGHDLGRLIPQITINQLNINMPLILWDSSRTNMMNCFSVRMDGEKTACNYLLPPMVACSLPVDLPLTPNVGNIVRSVYVGMSLADIIGGLIGWAGNSLVKKFLPNAYAAALGKMLVGLAASYAQHKIDPRYPVSAQVKFKFLGGEVKVGVSGGSSDTANNPSSASASYEKANSSGTASGSAKATYTTDADGDASKEGFDAKAVGRAGPATATGKSHVDPKGNSSEKGSWGPGL